MSEAHEIEVSMAGAKKVVAMGDALGRLMKNPDFKLLILDGYLKDEAVRLVHAKANPACQRADIQAAIVKDIDAIGSLDQYFRTVDIAADQAATSIEEAENALTEIAGEGVE